ncbi:MAG: tetratricopeptide repeat protein [Desulfohalobiaceae bacterium]
MAEGTYESIVRNFIQKQGGNVVLVSYDHSFSGLLRSLYKLLGLGQSDFFRVEEPDRYIETIKNIFEQNQNNQVLLFIEASIRGRTFFDELRTAKQAFGQRCKIICLSTEVSDQMTAYALESGADNMIVKPISTNSLLQKVAHTVQPNNLRKLVSKCEQLIDSGDLVQAARLVEQIFERKSNSSIGLMLLGDIAKQEKRYQDAEKHYQDASKQAELFLTPLKRLARLYKESGKLEERLAVLEKLDKLSPMNYERKIDIGRIYIKQDNPDKAQNVFNDALGTVKNHMADMVSSVHMEIGRSFEQLDPEAGFEHMSQALELKKDHMTKQDVWMYNELGRNLRSQGKWQEAIEQYQKARQVAPDDPQILYNMGMAYAQGKSFDKASSCIDMALHSNRQMFAGNAAASFNIGMIYRHAGKIDKAIEYLRTCLEHEPKHKQAMAALKQLENHKQ